MKAYQIRIDLVDAEPQIWRRIIMPADATFHRLHQIIQFATNFQDYHLFEFNLEEENMIVTNNDELYRDHQYFKENRKELEEHLEKMDPKFRKFEEVRQENMKKVVRKPTGLKMDSYLEKYKTISYLYDYGDNWRVSITLEKVMEDYHYGYPTLVDGEGTAPPEDVGGWPGYSDFLKIYYDPDHPDHGHLKSWASNQIYWEYDPEFVTRMLKHVKYKPTEWDKIESANPEES